MVEMTRGDTHSNCVMVGRLMKGVAGVKGNQQVVVQTPEPWEPQG